MSTLKVEVVKVEVGPHPNADRLDLCKISGKSWQCVAQKNQYQTGNLAIYIPIDSVLPPELVSKLGIEKLYNKRIRTVKLRGYISQGMLAPLDILEDSSFLKEGDEVTSRLGITKYEEPVPIEMAGKLLPDEPGMLKYTDIENIKNFPNIFSQDDIIVAREKIHGSNFRAAKLNGKLFVGSHNRNLVRDEGNLYWRAAKLLELDEKLAEGEQVFAEVFGNGVQDLTYGRKQGEISVLVFDLFKDGKYLSDAELSSAAGERFWKLAPLVYHGPLSGFQMPKKSLICPEQIIEGVVIRPEQEAWNESLGRKILKSISEEYLLRKDGTERH